MDYKDPDSTEEDNLWLPAHTELQTEEKDKKTLSDSSKSWWWMSLNREEEGLLYALSKPGIEPGTVGMESPRLTTRPQSLLFVK